jgi:hypothetical protein
MSTAVTSIGQTGGPLARHPADGGECLTTAARSSPASGGGAVGAGRRGPRAIGSHQDCSVPGGQVPTAAGARAAAAGRRP